jgi:DUF1009 family protein
VETAPLGIIAGSGSYPLELARNARARGVGKVVVCGFTGETSPEMAPLADAYAEVRVGQLSKMIGFFARNGVARAIMAGQIAPGNLFQLRPDLKALLLLARLKERNAASIFSAIADDLEKEGIQLLSAVTYLEDHLPEAGWTAGPPLSRRQKEDVAYGFRIAKEVSRLDIGQMVVVKKGTVLAVEGFEGTNAALRRGGELGRGGAVAVKVSKPGQDFRFDVPVIGTKTLETARDCGVAVIACEARKTLLLEREALMQLAREAKITLTALDDSSL